MLITHTDTDPFNPDHPIAYAAVNRARGLASGAGVSSAFNTITPPVFYLFEPHQPELCNFTPNTFVDITSVMEAKLQAMDEMKAQKYLQTYYGQRADQRGNHARRSSGNQDIRQAEAFQRVTPNVVSSAMNPNRATMSSPHLGSATVYEAGRATRLRRRRPDPGRPGLAGRPDQRARCAAARTTTSWSTPRWQPCRRARCWS